MLGVSDSELEAEREGVEVTEGVPVSDPVTVAHCEFDRVALGQADRVAVEDPEGQKVPEMLPDPEVDAVDVRDRVGVRLRERVGLRVVEGQKVADSVEVGDWVELPHVVWVLERQRVGELEGLKLTLPLAQDVKEVE